jgi:hypothetical protein
MQPYLFPYIGYFQLINAVDKFVILDDVTFIKKGWINRNRILLNNKEFLFTIPVEKISQNKLIKDTKVFDKHAFNKKFYTTINQVYKKAVNYEVIFNLIKKIMDFETEYITQINHFCISEVCNYLEIKTQIVKTSSIYENTNLKAENRIMDICFKEKADYYINPIGGKDIYDKNMFQSNNLKINFLNTDNIVYKQFENEFIPFLSIIDVLMFNSKDNIKEMLLQYKLM